MARVKTEEKKKRKGGQNDGNMLRCATTIQFDTRQKYDDAIFFGWERKKKKNIYITILRISTFSFAFKFHIIHLIEIASLNL